MLNMNPPPSTSSKTNPMRREPPRETAYDTAMRILIVDQDRQVGVALSFMLAARRYDDVRAVRSAERAMAIAEQFRPELVFLDVDLPDERSVMVAQSLTRSAQQRRMRIVALTTAVDSPACAQARAAGVKSFLVKPVSREELDRVLGIPAGAPLP
jgi:PleD family two-component response regulator